MFRNTQTFIPFSLNFVTFTYFPKCCAFMLLRRIATLGDLLQNQMVRWPSRFVTCGEEMLNHNLRINWCIL